MAYHFSDHAHRQAQSRGVRARDVELVILFGRKVYARHALIFVVGRNEVAELTKAGKQLDRLHGIHVICDPRTKTIFDRLPEPEIAAPELNPTTQT